MVFVSVSAQEEYTLVYQGDVQGTVSIRRDRGGKITITPSMTKLDSVEIIDNALCPLIPAAPKWAPTLSISNFNAIIVIEGSTRTETYPGGTWSKTIIQDNTATETRSSGWWQKTVVEGNTTTKTISNGQWNKTVVEGNTTTETNLATGAWEKWVVEGGITTTTSSGGRRTKRVVDRQGNTIYITQSRG
jgi:hypothetical protein